MKIHFIGIGGIGMSALAEVMSARGHKVSGSDLRPNDLTEKLAAKGVSFFKGHSSVNVPFDANLVVMSTSIRADNPEIVRAKNLGIKIIPRSDMLRDILKSAGTSIGVTGTHGKTTTSALVSYIMEFDGLNPTVIVGGEMDYFKGNAKAGSEDLVIAEVDESDGRFRSIETTSAIITNVEREHMEHYSSMASLLEAYELFVSGVSPDGFLAVNGEDELLSGVSGSCRARKITFAIDPKVESDYAARDVQTARSVSFNLFARGKKVGALESGLVGAHNCMNILAASALALEMGVGFDPVRRAVKEFKSVKRRFELVGKVGNIEVYEDYAHHPTELAAVIKSAREYRAKGRIISIFQPHRYSRTHDLADDFLNCFYLADVLILTDVYPADEDDFAGRGVMDIFEGIDKTRFESVSLMNKNDIPSFVPRIVAEDDTVLVLGAGDIREIARPILAGIREKKC